MKNEITILKESKKRHEKEIKEFKEMDATYEQTKVALIDFVESNESLKRENCQLREGFENERKILNITIEDLAERLKQFDQNDSTAMDWQPPPPSLQNELDFAKNRDKQNTAKYRDKLKTVKKLLKDFADVQANHNLICPLRAIS